VKTNYSWLCGLLLFCASAFAEQQAFITIDPNNFAPGQNVSNATTGARLRAVTAVLNPDPNPPPAFTYVLQYSPSVFAQSVTAGCMFEGIPCAATGNLEFGWDATLPLPSTQPIVWGSGQSAAACLTSFCDSTSAFGLDHAALRIDFSVPTDHVNSLILYVEGDGGWMEAFNSAGQSLGHCTAFPPGEPAGCVTAVFNSPLGNGGWFLYTLTRSAADISYVFIGAADHDLRAISRVQFDSPVSLQLAGLLTKVQGVGPGKSLANAIMFAQTYYAVPDIQSTCATLTGFMGTVKAQSGKSINKLTASQLLATAQAIEVAIHCN
jgi:hypothetical protein